jgi:hypothetical protein
MELHKLIFFVVVVGVLEVREMPTLFLNALQQTFIQKYLLSDSRGRDVEVDKIVTYQVINNSK